MQFLAARPPRAGDGQGARVVLMGAPYDGTASYRSGSRWGPARIREASHSLEEYSLLLDASLEDVDFTDLGDLELPFGSPGPVLSRIEAAVGQAAAAGSVPFLLGGDHTITLGAVRALTQHLGPGADLTVVQIDAHADLRDEYLGEPLSHATVMRRVAEVVGAKNVYATGIRSGSASEIAWGRANVNWLDQPVPEAAAAAARSIGRRPLYVTIDIDVLDPAVAPGTGNAEPGGITFQELIAAIGALKGCSIVGVDLVEVAPPLDPSGRTEITAAAIVRHILLSWFL